MKNPKINYTSRDFTDLKSDLIQHLKKYYPEVVNDYSDASIAGMLTDTVAYIGDILSYQLDFQTNETFLDSAIVKSNVENIGKQLGYKESSTNSLLGTVSFYILIPANNQGTSPDYDYAPTIKKGTIIKSNQSNITLQLIDDVVVDNKIVSSYVPAIFNNTNGRVTYYAVKVYGNVQTFTINEDTIEINSFEPFKKITLLNSNVLEIINVTDFEGNTYFEAPTLTQNIIYKSIPVNSNDINDPKFLLRPVHAARRFMTERDGLLTTLIFGGKSVNNTINLRTDVLAEPSKVALKKYKSDYIVETYLEPNKLIDNDEFGIGPENTSITIKYTSNAVRVPSIQAGSITSISNLSISFKPEAIDETKKNKIISAVEVINEEAIVGGTSGDTIEELRQRIGASFQMQNRAVTERDYETACYLMPERYGKIKRVRVMRDKNSLKNNLNIYVVGEDNTTSFVTLNTLIKQNLKTWLNQYRILTDTVDILDAKIINLGIKYEIIVDTGYIKEQVLIDSKEQLKNFYSVKSEIGQPFLKTDILRELRKVPGILDVTKLEIENKSSLGYSSIAYNLKNNTSPDGRLIKIPENCVYEIKYFDTDVIGVAK